MKDQAQSNWEEQFANIVMRNNATRKTRNIYLIILFIISIIFVILHL